MNTDEGSEDATANVPRGAPCVSDECAADELEFAEALRALCQDVAAAA